MPRFAAALLLVLAACPTGAEPRFVERSAALGVDFVHDFFGTGEKYMPENMGPGLAVVDVDGDDRLDLFFVQGAPVALGEGRGETPPAGAGHRLYRQRADGTFEDVSAKALPRSALGVGMGVCFGDVEGDGDLDLYITHYGPDLFLRNRGDGTFEDATVAMGFADGDAKNGPTWSAGCTFFDAEGDGDLDLYVSRYVDFSLDNHKFCGNAEKKLRSYCHPDVYAASDDAFFRNDLGEKGEARFVDATRAAGIEPTPEGKGLGVLAADFDGNGTVDVFVANDSTMNSLWLGDGEGRFEESALLAGVGLNGAGAAEAGMGVARGDLDGDGAYELFLTHLDRETNTLYRPIADGLYADATEAAGLGVPSLPWVGFGVVFFDDDLDADLDVAVVNGHILDNVHLFDPTRSHRQPAQLLRNDGRGRFVEVAGALGDEPLVGRGLVAADLDRDGDLDLVATQNGGPAKVWENRGKPGGSAHASITVRLESRASAPHGLGARVELRTERADGSGKPSTTIVQAREMLAASSYLSQGPPEIVFARPAGESTLVVHWPSGRVDRVNVAKPGIVRVVEGSTGSGQP